MALAEDILAAVLAEASKAMLEKVRKGKKLSIEEIQRDTRDTPGDTRTRNKARQASRRTSQENRRDEQKNKRTSKAAKDGDSTD